MIEYAIIRRIKNGLPIFFDNYLNYDSMICDLNSLIALAEEWGGYYVDNDFFNNKYPKDLKNITYFKVVVREITPFKEYSIKKCNSNIYYKYKSKVSVNDFYTHRNYFDL